MRNEQNKIDRRNFLKTVGAAGLGSVLASAKIQAEPNAPAKAEEPAASQMPKRKLGKTGVEVPVLALGMIFDALEKQIVLRKQTIPAHIHPILDWRLGYSGELGPDDFIPQQMFLDKKENLYLFYGIFQYQATLSGFLKKHQLMNIPT